ncbi:DMT family transporter [Candidatus Pelagibacter sp.]|nr:DMT family transporter [Candidatus Pelagibacter sp.]MDA7574010.1 DMT family transporter [Candidatus Pelagibacter sp.]MDB3964166.1 DMT family transporter [Candidatus Pelagibacter sp.]MDB4612893.1 DMT family transporter [Candidatus Pelagibacter sp.]MDB9792758.1 DMT family transporter [Candidatus Pelagibacter sp.]
MPLKHLLILLFIAFAYGSAFPITKLALNDSVPPILMASLRMGIVLIILIPFWRFKIPNKKYLPSLIAFSISMGVLVYVFMTLSLYHSSIISPVIVGSQLAIPFGVLLSGLMLGEKISQKKWVLVFCAFFGIVIIFFDPELANNFLGLFYAGLMALFFGLAQVYSRQLKSLDVSLTNAFTGLFGFIILLILSYFVEGDTVLNIKSISNNTWAYISYQAIIVSLGAHLLMFYLYKFYTVGQIFPSYSLFPIFGIGLSFLIFGEIPTLLFLIGSIIVLTSVFLLHKTR